MVNCYKDVSLCPHIMYLINQFIWKMFGLALWEWDNKKATLSSQQTSITSSVFLNSLSPRGLYPTHININALKQFLSSTFIWISN